MSRLQAGALGTAPQALSVAEAVVKAVADQGPAALAVGIHIPDELAEVRADPALLERILANVLSNALRYSPDDRPPMVTRANTGGFWGGGGIDPGPGVPGPARGGAFPPFHAPVPPP